MSPNLNRTNFDIKNVGGASEVWAVWPLGLGSWDLSGTTIRLMTF